MKSDRFLTSQPPDLHQAIKDAAKKAGVSKSEWIGEQCIRALPKSVRQKLAPRPKEGRPKSKETTERGTTRYKI